MSPLVFVMPDGREEISGGNLYNAQLLAALANLGPVASMGVSEFASAPLPPATYLVDTLNLEVAQHVLARRSPGQRFVLLVHHLPSLEPGLDLTHPSRLLEDAVLREFDGYVATGEFTRGWLSQQGLAGPILLLEPAVAGGPEADRKFSDPMRALMVCNLIPRKGVLEFLEGLADGFGRESASPQAHYSIAIVGRNDLDPEYGQACARVVAQCRGLSQHVSLAGPVPHEEMASWYRSANLFVSASRMETYGIALQEARHFGLPILAVRGGNSENHLIVDRTGQLFDTPGALADGLLRLSSDVPSHASLFESAQRLRPAIGPSWEQGAQRLLASLVSWFSEA